MIRIKKLASIWLVYRAMFLFKSLAKLLAFSGATLSIQTQGPSNVTYDECDVAKRAPRQAPILCRSIVNSEFLGNCVSVTSNWGECRFVKQKSGVSSVVAL